MTARKVLLAWEFGAGFGHTAKLAILGQELARRGWHPRYVLRDPSTATVFGIDPGDIVQAPDWPPTPLPDISGSTFRQSLTFGQNLGMKGFHHAPTLRAMLGEWQTLLASENPDLVISDYAPTLNLACRGRLPVLLVGSGFTVPPPDIGRYPRLHDQIVEPVFVEDAILEAIDVALAGFGLPPIASLPEVMSGTASFPCTLSVLDPYDGFRSAPVCGPLDLELPEIAIGHGDRVFAYLKPVVFDCPPIVRAVADLGQRATVFVQDAAQHAREVWPEAEVLAKPVDLPTFLPQMSAMVHQGGHGLACSGVLCGLPQLALTTNIENRLTGLALERHGIGFRRPLRNATDESLAEALLPLLEDEDLAARARAVAQKMRRTLGAPAVEQIVTCADEVC